MCVWGGGGGGGGVASTLLWIFNGVYPESAQKLTKLYPLDNRTVGVHVRSGIEGHWNVEWNGAWNY